MSLLYYVSPKLTDEILGPVVYGGDEVISLRYWINLDSARRTTEAWIIYLAPLVYDHELKTFVKNGLDYYRLTDAISIDEYLALPIDQFLKRWNEKEYRHLSDRRVALLDQAPGISGSAPQKQQNEKNLNEIETLLSLFDEWFHVNGFKAPTAMSKEGIQKSMAAVVPPMPIVSMSTSLIPTPVDVMLDAYVTEYLSSVKTNQAAKTHNLAERAFKNFAAAIGNKKMSEITAQDLEIFKTTRKGQSVSLTTVNMEVRAIKAGFNVAVDWGKLDESPFTKVKQLKISQTKKDHLTKAQYRTLIDKIDAPWMKDIVEFDVLTGLRLGELMNLKWKDFNEVNKKVTIQSSVEYQVKAGKMREVPLNERAIEIIKSKEPINEWIFLSDKGKKVTNDFVSKKFKEYVRIAKLPDNIHFHSLRHTFGTWAAEAGIPMHTIKNIMGHSSVTVTEGYIGMDQTAMQSEIGKVKTD